MQTDCRMLIKWSTLLFLPNATEQQLEANGCILSTAGEPKN